MKPSVQIHAKYTVFGDESITDHGVSYALLFIPTNRLKQAELAYETARQAHGVLSSQRMHAADLFAPRGRARTPFRHLVGRGVYDFIHDLLARLESADAFASYCYCQHGFAFGKATTFDVLQSFGLDQETKSEHEAPKAISVLVFKAAMFAAQNELKISNKRLDVHIDGDSTKLWFFGRRSKLTDRFTFFFNDDTSHARAHFISKPRLLEVADLLAYCYAQINKISAGYDRSKLRSVVNSFPHLGFFRFELPPEESNTP